MKNKTRLARLIRERDGMTFQGMIGFIEFDEIGRGKMIHDKPKVGYAIIVDPHLGLNFTWLTTPIKEIVYDTGTTVKVKTKNTDYTIEYLDEEEIRVPVQEGRIRPQA